MPNEVKGQPAPRVSVPGIGWRCLHAPIGLKACPPAPPEPLGADAFLPALTEELIWSPHIGETQLDVEFLMELLDPDELRGEGESPPQKRRDLTGGALGAQQPRPAAWDKADKPQGDLGGPG